MSNPTPWPGQISYIDGLCKVHHAPTYTEMAEAILDWVDGQDDGDQPPDPELFPMAAELYRVAARLRAIRATSE